MAYGKEEKKRSGYPFWIIVNRVRGSVWIGDRETCVFQTEGDAVAEYRRQVAALPPGVKTSYRVERVDAPGGAVQAREDAKREQVDQLEEFAREAERSVRMPFVN